MHGKVHNLIYRIWRNNSCVAANRANSRYSYDRIELAAVSYSSNILLLFVWSVSAKVGQFLHIAPFKSTF